MKNLVKLLFLCIFIGHYSFGLEWHDFFEENGNMVYQLRYWSKLFKKDKKNEEVNYNRETGVDANHEDIKSTLITKDLTDESTSNKPEDSYLRENLIILGSVEFYNF